MDGRDYGQKIDASLKYERVFVKCTWATAYARPRYRVNERIRTYNKKNVLFLNQQSKYVVNFQKKYFDLKYLEDNGYEYTVQNGQVGILTGEYLVDNYGRRNQVWLRAHLLYCDRANYGWFRSTDITPDVTSEFFKKQTENKPEEKSNWLWWLAAAVALLR